MGLHLIAAGGFWSQPESYLAILQVVIGLGLVIFVHELGHFLVAKACGVRCDKFYVGFDFFDIKLFGKVIIPRTLFKKKWGETEYGIGIIPLGGYVKMLGQDDNPAKAAEEMERAKIHKERQGDEPVGESGHDSPEEGISVKEALRHPDTLDVKTSSDKAGEDEEYELDPRSYQAKSVPQRMAIISAGVVMNLIFAVIFAMIAYMIGVPFTPCEVGATVAAGPAEQAGLEPGDRILQIGRDSEPKKHLRFSADLVQAVALNGDQQDLELLVQEKGEPADEAAWVAVRPSKDVRKFKGVSLAQIGVAPAGTTRLDAKKPSMTHLGIKGLDQLQGNDVIVEIEGQPVNDVHEMKAILVQSPDKELTFVVERAIDEDDPSAEATKVEIQVGPNPLKRLGLAMKAGSVTSIQPSSPAELAGLREGDHVLTIDGETLAARGGPILLSHYLRNIARENLKKSAGDKQSVSIAVHRIVQGKQVRKRFDVLPRLATTAPSYTSGRPIRIEELGVTLPVLNWVAAVEEGSPADGKLAAGDQILKADFLPAGDEQKKTEATEIGLTHEPIDLEQEPHDWPLVHTRMQYSLADTRVKVTYVDAESGKQETAELAMTTGGSWGEFYNPIRGINPQPLQEIHQAEGLGEAFFLGLRQTWEDGTRVLQFLKKLITGGISPTNLGGPGTIAVAATSEATHGPARLLLFLTLLSANLAVVNFLPIPVLDGGHMMFLIYEGIFRKPPSEKWFMRLTLVGFAFVLSLMLFVISLDVFRFANWF